MDTAQIALILRTQQENKGLLTAEVAKRAGCSVPEASKVLAGDFDAPAGLLVRVCAALDYELLAVPRPTMGAPAPGAKASEDKIESAANSPDAQPRPPISFGLLAGKVHVAPDFDAPLPPQIESSLERWDDAGEEDHTDSEPAAQERRREARRLALHQAAVRELRERPERAEQALEILERWLRMGFPDRQLAEEWRRIIQSKDWDALLETSERGKRLRKGSPVACILDPQQRFAIIRRFARNGPSS